VLEDISHDPDDEGFTEEDMVLPMNEDDTSDMDYCNDDKVGDGECDHVWDEERKKERDEEAFCELFPIPEEEELANEGPRAINFIGVPPGYYEDTDEPFQVSDNGSPSADVHKHGAPPSGCSDPVGKSTLTPRNFEDSSGLQANRRPRKKTRIEKNMRLSAAGRHDGSNYALLDRHVSANHRFVTISTCVNCR